MSIRRMSVLLILAAVLAMHGIPALSAVGAGGHDTVVAADVDMAMAAPSAAVLALAEFDGQGDIFVAVQAPVTPQTPETPDHGTDAHLWAACLAILLAGIALLAAVGSLRRGAVPFLRGPTAWPRWPAGWSRILRPADFFALCLLRI